MEKIKIITLFFASSFAIAFPLFSQAGNLDTSFNSTGIVLTHFGGNDFGNAVALQPDGKILVAGSTDIGNAFAIARYDVNGSLDVTFDTDGKQTTSFMSGLAESNAIVLQPNGKIVIVGQSITGSNYDFGVVRYDINGSLDTSFGSDGQTMTPILSDDDYPYATLLQPDGKIVVAGYANTAANTNDFAIVRYNSNGTLDNTFDVDGKQTTDYGISDDDCGYACVLQTDGKLIVAGYATNSSSMRHFCLVRYNSDGSLDPSFDSDGIVYTSVGSNDVIYAIAIQPDGKIVVGGGGSAGGHKNFALARYNTNGSLDLSFDSDGIVTTPMSTHNNCISALTIQPDGKIVVVGYVSNLTNTDFGVARYNSDGSLDDCFSNDGMQLTPIGTDYDDGQGVAIQTDGKIIAVGDSYNNTTLFDFAIIRYLGVCGNIGLEEPTVDQLKIYPNPSTGDLHIELNENFDFHSQLRITNGLGEVVYAQEFYTQKASLDLNQLPSGTYYLEIVGENIRVNKCFVITPE